MSILSIFTSVFFGVWAIRSVLFWVSLWQDKEYRFDRMLVHVQETEQGKKLFFSPVLILKIIAIILFAFVIIHPLTLIYYQIVVAMLFLYEAFVVFQEVKFHRLKRPKPTVKALAIILLSLFALLLFFWVPLLEWAVWLLLLDRILPLIVAIFVYFSSFPTEMQRDFKIGRAIEKLREHKKLLVVGITGSYGKSSTKEFTAQILRKKFRVVKTKGTNNTPIGIANAILSSLQPKTEIFVVEMGAYKKGEIAQLCRIVHPKIGVLTSVNEQHVSLFGGLAKTMETKYELIEALPKNGLALFNGNNENTRALYAKTTVRKVLYTSDISLHGAILATNIVVDKRFVTFDVVIGRKKFTCTAPVIGKQAIENMLPGIYIASYLGMTSSEIVDAVSMLSAPDQTMTYHEVGGVSIIDDAFNANPDSVLAVLDYMRLYTGKKILVLQPMIELGKHGREEHERIGKAIADVCDILLLTNSNYLSALKAGLRLGKRKCTVFVGTSQVIAQYVTTRTKKGDIVVFEGKEAGLPLEKIL